MRKNRKVTFTPFLAQAGFVEIDVVWMRAGHAIFGGWKHDLTG